MLKLIDKDTLTLDGRKLQKMRQEAWLKVNHDYKNEPELCFALGFDAGYNAVAPRVEPRLSESGEGFESLPALRLMDLQQKIDDAFSNSGAQVVCRRGKKGGSHPVRVFLPKQWSYFVDYLSRSIEDAVINKDYNETYNK